MYPSDYDNPTRYGGPSQDSFQDKSVTSAGLTTRESVELFQEAVDTAHDEYRRTLTGIDAPSDDVKPKLTVDLRRRGLSSIPKEVIAIIKQDVERYDSAVAPSCPSLSGRDSAMSEKLISPLVDCIWPIICYAQLHTNFRIVPH